VSGAADLVARSYVALVHHPVVDREAKIVTTAITNLDIHDIARSCRTYGLAGYFVVTPITAQRQLAEQIVGHWTQGAGREHNSKRSDALELVSVVPALSDAVREITAREGTPPLVVATGARPRAGVCGYRALRDEGTPPMLVVFGTGWGLADEVFQGVDRVLEPIRGLSNDNYNHLSVRSAVAIVLDRLFGSRE
jgi:hypothetical protein